ncbi:golgin subfamily B member 1 isoform X3 [Xenopus laevis]|uniref:Golgin subfamily B member 1 isoform X3 n=1 Tax=Xenopus laevis TaxID=8355 RepID=A0A8J0V041_XENLA|nr:golgin subfamily B member 1 isoform X3 [Xenopus laevis]
MWKWYSGDESTLQGGAPDNEGSPAGTMSVADLTEQLAQTEQLVVQLKELIREKDNELRKKDQQLKEEKESAESKISKAKLQNKAKIVSLTSQLEELKKQQASSRPHEKKSESKKASGDGDYENSSANRGKILLLKRRVEELESQLAHKNEELQKKEADLEQQRLRGSQMDAMLSEKEQKLAAKEAYIIDLQMAAGSNTSKNVPSSQDNTQETNKDTANQELQILIQNLTRKVGESDEKCSLLQEQAESLKTLLNKEKDHFKEREAMYTENIRVFQNLVQEKEKELKEQSQKHEQDIFKLLAKSDANADLHQLLKALKQKLHEEEEVLLGKNQVIDVLQKELDNKEQQNMEITEKCKRLQSEKENLQSKLEAEKHVMRAQLRDMMDKHETELRGLHDKHVAQIQEIQEKHELEIQEKCLTVQQLQHQLQNLGNNVGETAQPTNITEMAVVKLQDEVKLKTEEASKSDAKFLKMKAWSKSKIRQLEEELKISQGKNQDLRGLSNRIVELEEEKHELETKLETLTELQAINEQLLAKLVLYEEQQRKLQADLEQVAKRADSQTSESGSVDELHNQLLEWNEMSPEMEEAPENSGEEKSVLALRMAQIEEEREGLIEDDWFFPGCSDPAMDSGQQELEEELSAARGLGKMRPARRKGSKAATKMQEEDDYSRKGFDDQNVTLDSIDSAEGENMGGWWAEYASPNSGMCKLDELPSLALGHCDAFHVGPVMCVFPYANGFHTSVVSGLRTVVEELELERNQLQEQIMSLEDRCQELEDRLQLQLRIESLQGENERLQAQLGQLRQQQNRETEKQHSVTSTLSEQLKGFTDRNAFLENVIAEKEQIILEAAGKLEELARLKKILKEKEDLNKAFAEKLDQSELQLEETRKKLAVLEAENQALKLSNNELTEKAATLKEKLLKQDAALEKMQLDLEQTNEELDRLNTSHLEERSQLIYDLQRCEREMDVLREVLQEKDKELASLSSSLTEYNEQVVILKEQIDLKNEQMREMSDALVKAERESQLLREAQTSDTLEMSDKISSLTDQLSEMDMELNKAKYLSETKAKEAEELIRQINENGITIKNLRSEIQAQSATHNNHAIECSTQITSLKQQINASVAKLDETETKYRKEIESLKLQLESDVSEREKIAGLLAEKSSQERSFENELKVAKEQYNNLVSGISKKDEEIEKLLTEVAEQKKFCDHLRKELQIKEKDASSLQEKLLADIKDREEKLRGFQESTQALQAQLSEKLDNINKSDATKNELVEQNKILKTALSEKDKNLEVHLTATEECRKSILELEQHNQQLLNEKEHLAKELSEQKQFYDDLKKELNIKEENSLCLQQKLEMDINNRDEKLTVLEERVQELQKQLDEELENIHNLNTAKDELDKRNKILEVALAEREKNLSVHLNKTEECRKHILDLEQQKQQLYSEKEHLVEELAQQKQCCDHLTADLQATEQKASTFQQKHEAHLKDRDEQLRVLQESTQKLQKQLEEKVEHINTLDAAKNELCEQKKKLESSLAEKNENLGVYQNSAEELRRNIVDLEQQKQQLHSEKEHIRQELSARESALLSLNQVLHDLQGKMSEMELLLMEEKKWVSQLTLDKEELQLKISHMSEQSLERDTVISKQLEDKALESFSLKDQLSEEKQNAINLLNQIHVQENQLKESQKRVQQSVEELELMKVEYNTIFESLKQNEERNVELQKHVEELTTALGRENQALKAELEQWKASFAALQNEENILREEHKRVSLQITELSAELLKLNVDRDRLQQEAVQKTEENASLLKSLDSINVVADTLKREKEEALSLIISTETQRDSLQSLLLQSQLETDTLKKELDNFKADNVNLHSEIERVNNTLANKSEEIRVLTSHLSQQANSISSLKDHIDTVLVEKQTLLNTVEEKETLVRQKEELIQLAEKKREGESHYLQKISDLQNEVQSSVSERMQLQHTIKEREVKLTNLAQELKLYKDKSEEAQLVKVQLAEQVEVISDLHCQIKSLREREDELNIALNEKAESLKEKVDSFVNLNALYVGVQETLDNQKKQIDSLLTESENYKTLLSEKDSAIQKSGADYEEIKINMADKERLCENLRQQVAELELINTSQNKELSEINLKVIENGNSLLAKESRIQELAYKVSDLEWSVVEKESAVQNLQEKYALLHDCKLELEQSVVVKEEEISRLLYTAREKDERLQATEANAQDEIGLLREELHRYTSNLKDTSITLQEKDEAMLQKQQMVQTMELQLNSVTEANEMTTSQLHSLTREKEQQNLLIQQLQEKCNSQSQQIIDLKSDADLLNAKLLKTVSEHALQKEQYDLQVQSAKQQSTHLENELQALQAEKEHSMGSLQIQLTKKADAIKELKEKLDLHVKEAETQLCSSILQLKTENSDLQKQVSARAEEILALKLNIETLEHNHAEQQQQSENALLKVNEENDTLANRKVSLESEIQMKENMMQTLLKDMRFVEEQLSMLCDENLPDCPSFGDGSSYNSKLEGLCSMFSVALKHKSDMAELKQILETKDHEIDQKSASVQSLEKELAAVQDELQILRDGSTTEKEFLMKEIGAFKFTSHQQERLLQEREEINTLVATLQEEQKASKAELEKCYRAIDKETNKVKELLEDAKNKEMLIENLSIQLNQQKELITALSEQIKDKDASIMQVMESMSNDIVKSSEERDTLNSEIQKLQSEINGLSEKLEACKTELQSSQATVAEKEVSLSNLVNEKDKMQLQLEKFSKEKENMKRKLQAALVVRKDLIKKLETIEKTKQEEVNNKDIKIEEIKGNAEELNSKLAYERRQKEDLKSQIEHLMQESMEKDRRTSELLHDLNEKETHLKEIQDQALVLQHRLSEKENICEEYKRAAQVNEINISQIREMSEKIKTLEEENLQLHQNIETLKSDLEKNQNHMSPVEPQASINPNKPDDALHQEKTVVHNNVHASLLCSEQDTDIPTRDDYAKLLEDLNHGAKELEHLKTEHADLQKTCQTLYKVNEESEKQVHILQQQIHFQQEQLTNKEHLAETQRQKIESILQALSKKEQHENIVLELTSNIEEKDSQLGHLCSEKAKLLDENQMLKDKMQKLLAEHEVKLEEVHNMKSALQRLDQYETDKEMMATEIRLLQQKLESSQLVVQQIGQERDTYFEAQRMKQVDIEQLKDELVLASQDLLEKGTELARVQDLLQENIRTSSSDVGELQNKLTKTEHEAIELQNAFDKMKEEMSIYVSKLERANTEIFDLQLKLKDYSKEDETLIQRSSTQSLGIHYGDLENVSDAEPQRCHSCSAKETMIEELKRQVLQNSKAMSEPMQQQESKSSELSAPKEQLQRKLQAALISRKEVLKESKLLKQNVESLRAEMAGLQQSFAEAHEKKSSEICLLSREKEDLLTEKNKLLSVNENLSAACDSLKTTMETIVQEKEAFSFQLNSLKDSQTVELSGWKARHAELNKEYESLLQAYENIGDEMYKMRQVIEMTKKEKNELLRRGYGFQTENHDLVMQIEENSDETDRLRTMLECREQDIKMLENEVDRITALDKTPAEVLHRLKELSNENNQLTEENRRLVETCELIKISSKSIEEENNNLLISKNSLENSQIEMDAYKHEMEIKMSELLSVKEELSKTVAGLNMELAESRDSLADVSTERSQIVEEQEKLKLMLKEQMGAVLKLESDLNVLHLEKINLDEKVKILEDDKSILQEEIESVQEQFCKVKNEKEFLEADLLNAARNNKQLTETFKSLQVQTNSLSQQVECLRSEKNNIMREKEEHQLQILRELEQRVKCAQDDNWGTKSKSKELQELLKEKQQEISQLQRDSIRFQELILDLEGSVKESSTQNESLKAQLDKTVVTLESVCKEASSLNKELSNKKHTLESGKDQIARLTAELQGVRSLLVERGFELIEEQSGEVDRGGKLPRTDNGDEFASYYKASSEEYMLIKDKYALNGTGVWDDGAEGRLQELAETHPIQQAQKIPKSEHLYHKQSVGNNIDLESTEKNLQAELAKKETDLQEIMSERDKMRADLEKQVSISEHMKQILNDKDAEISMLLSSKDGPISNYLEQIQGQYRKRLEEYEQQLNSFQEEKERSRMEYQRTKNASKELQAKYEKAINDNTLISSEIESFRKSMSSLQSDRDLLCSEFKDINGHHKSVITEKEGVIGNTVSENIRLKQELRNSVNQIDDLNAENAMLGAQLIRYREDLNQVLSLKDHQLKELLRQKLEHIKNLEQEKSSLQRQYREVQNASTLLKQELSDCKLENEKLSDKVKDQEALIATINKEKIVSESKKKESGSAVQEKLSSLQHDVSEIEKIDNTHPGESNSKPMENPTELKTYWEICNENKELKSQNESFGKAMAALQNDRDSLIENFKVLQWRYMSELKAERLRGDGLERQSSNFKSLVYGLLKKNSLLDDALIAEENAITLDQLAAKVDSICSTLAGKVLEVNRLSSECTGYQQQINAFAKAMASLQNDRERLLQELKVGASAHESKQAGEPNHATESEYLTMNMSQASSGKDTQVSASSSSSTAENTKLRTKVAELERQLWQSRSYQDKAEQEINSYQCELAQLRSEKNLLVTEVQALQHRSNTSLAEKDRQIAEFSQMHKGTALVPSTLYGTKEVERVALVGSTAGTEKVKPSMDVSGQPEIQRYLQEIKERDHLIQQINSKAMESVQMNAMLSAQLNTVTQGLKDSQMRYSDLQNHYYKLQRDLQALQVTNQSDIQAQVPPGAPQERASVLVEIENSEFIDLRRRLVESEHLYDTIQQELSHLSERLAEERALREAAEDALQLAEQQNKSLEMKTSSRDYEFSLQMESDDEREALIIDPAQHVMVRKMKGGALSLRRWLRGRSLYCSKLLTSRSKTRYLFLGYLLVLHAAVLMCLTGVL